MLFFQAIVDDIKDNKPLKDIISDVRELSVKNIIPEHEVIGIVWGTIMSLGEWNKKEELVADQALRHLRNYTQFLQAFTTSDRSELALMLRVQDWCYDNMNFMNSFQKIILLFYKSKFHSILGTYQRSLLPMATFQTFNFPVIAAKLKTNSLPEH